MVADLSDAAAREQVESRISELDSLELLINIAGFGTWDKFAESDLNQQLDMVKVHIVATMQFCRTALPNMIAHHRGTIINVASIGAFLPAVRNATYNATKAYMVSLSESLQAELRGTGVQIQALCPGFTYTEFHNSAQYDRFVRSQIHHWLWSSAESIVTQSLSALERGQSICITGIQNQILIAFARSSLMAPFRQGASRYMDRYIGLNR